MVIFFKKKKKIQSKQEKTQVPTKVRFIVRVFVSMLNAHISVLEHFIGRISNMIYCFHVRTQSDNDRT